MTVKEQKETAKKRGRPRKTEEVVQETPEEITGEEETSEDFLASVIHQVEESEIGTPAEKPQEAEEEKPARWWSGNPDSESAQLNPIEVFAISQMICTKCGIALEGFSPTGARGSRFTHPWAESPINRDIKCPFRGKKFSPPKALLMQVED